MPQERMWKPGPKAKMESERLIFGHPNFMSMWNLQGTMFLRGDSVAVPFGSIALPALPLVKLHDPNLSILDASSQFGSAKRALWTCVNSAVFKKSKILGQQTGQSYSSDLSLPNIHVLVHLKSTLQLLHTSTIHGSNKRSFLSCGIVHTEHSTQCWWSPKWGDSHSLRSVHPKLGRKFWDLIWIFHSS